MHEAGESESSLCMRKASKYLIYGLRENGSKEIRYVGKSSSGVRRPRSHWSEFSLKTGYPVHNWTKSLVQTEKVPEILILQEFIGLDDVSLNEKNNKLNEAEISWIKKFQECGHRLLNMTNGGDGLLGWSGEKHPMFGRKGEKSPRFGVRHTEKSRKKMSEALSGTNHPHFGIHKTDETKRKIGFANLGKKNGMYGKVAVNKGVPLSEDMKENLREKCGKKIESVSDGRVFRSQVEAATFYGINRNTVGQSCRGLIKKTSNGLSFRFVKP